MGKKVGIWTKANRSYYRGKQPETRILPSVGTDYVLLTLVKQNCMLCLYGAMNEKA